MPAQTSILDYLNPPKNTSFGGSTFDSSSIPYISNAGGGASPDIGFANAESSRSEAIGRQAASYADPFGPERAGYAGQLKDITANPGNVTSNPYYQFLITEAMNQVKANNAGRGLRNSGRGAVALQDRAQGVASQAFFPLADLYSKLSGATTGSPGTAGIAYMAGANRGQDYRGISQANRNMTAPGGAQTPWWMQNLPTPGTGTHGGLPTGGGTNPYQELLYKTGGYGGYGGGAGTGPIQTSYGGDNSYGLPGGGSPYDPIGRSPDGTPYMGGTYSGLGLGREYDLGQFGPGPGTPWSNSPYYGGGGDTGYYDYPSLDYTSASEPT